jgi:hypothetical protein
MKEDACPKKDQVILDIQAFIEIPEVDYSTDFLFRCLLFCSALLP